MRLRKSVGGDQRNGSCHARVLSAMLRHRLTWIGPRQEIGIFSRLDLKESCGEEGEQFAVDLLARVADECSRLS